MKDYSLEVDIDASRAACFATFADFGHLPDIMRHVKAMVPNPDGTWNWTETWTGIKHEYPVAIVEQVQDEMVAWAATDDSGHSGRVHFADLPQGGTKMMLLLEVEGHGWGETLIEEKMGVPEVFAGEALDDFKEYMEAQPEQVEAGPVIAAEVAPEPVTGVQTP